jgi:hypothetical protein
MRLETYGDLFSFIDFFAVTDAKHDNVVALNIEDHAIITDAETVASEFRSVRLSAY